MRRPFDPDSDRETLHKRIIGLGEQSSRKSYYPELQKHIEELGAEIGRREIIENELHLKTRMLEDEIAYRQRAEEEAGQERDNFRSIFESAPVGMMLINENCRVMDANRVLAGICGKPVESLFNKVPGQIFECAYTTQDSLECGHASECDDCRLREMVRGVVKSRKGLYGIELHHIRRKGSSAEQLWLKISIEPITVSGQPCAIIAVGDVTAQRQLEDELLRTRKLDSLGVLAGGIAHDFNNLLTGIMGNLSVALMRCGDNQQIATPVERALQASERATDLTRQLLTFAKGGAPVKQLASLAGIVRESAEFALRGADVAVEFSIPEDLWSAEVDVGQINQVISNLVINADQAMPGGGQLRIVAENLETPELPNLPILQAGRYIRITIADQGVGIPSDCLERIFDPYYTTKQHGNGLGLATVHSIINRHGGGIKVVSEISRGTIFTIWLPASDRTLDPGTQMSGIVPIGKGKILVMDDEAIIRELTQDMLDMLGYECVTCGDGQLAYELYSQALESGVPFKAVILDLTIPGGMGGVETMARIRNRDPAALGIVASGYSNDQIIASFCDYGFAAAVPKPFSIQQLSAALAAISNSSDALFGHGICPDCSGEKN